MLKRRPFKQKTALEDRLTAWARKIREQAEMMKPGPQKEALLQKASQAEMAAEVNDWINSPGSRPPPQAIEVGIAISEARRRAAKEKTKSRGLNQLNHERRCRAVLPLLDVLIVALFAFISSPAVAETIAGQASVVDGDTLEISEQCIRLSGIDAPESDQLCVATIACNYRCGAKAANALEII